VKTGKIDRTDLYPFFLWTLGSGDKVDGAGKERYRACYVVVVSGTAEHFFIMVPRSASLSLGGSPPLHSIATAMDVATDEKRR